MIIKTLALLPILPFLFSVGNVGSNAPTKAFSYVTEPIPEYPEYSEFKNIAKDDHVHKVLDCPDGYVTEYCEVSKATYTENADVYLYKTTANFVSGHTANTKGETQTNGEKYNDSYLSEGYLHVAAYQYKGLEYGGEVDYVDQLPSSSKGYMLTYENGETKTINDTKMVISSLYLQNYENKHWEAGWSYQRPSDASEGELMGEYTLTTYLRFKMTNSVSYFNRDAFQSYINYSFTGMSLKRVFFTKAFKNGETYYSQGGKSYFI